MGWQPGQVAKASEQQWCGLQGEADHTFVTAGHIQEADLGREILQMGDCELLSKGQWLHVF